MSQPPARDARPMPDVQGAPDDRRLRIDQVGIRGLRHPVLIDHGASEPPQATVASVDMLVDLPAERKGTHMSRFVALLNEYTGALDTAAFEALLHEMSRRLDADSGRIEMRFPYFVRKSAPISGVASLMDYDVSLIGELEAGKTTVTLRVVVPVTSLCPCSRDISEYGAHNQRSHITLTARLAGSLSIRTLITIAEEEASCELFGLLKRPDEKFVTERAYDNPKFVEDAVRDVAARLDAEPAIAAYTAECENFESIHNHSAYARISRDKTTR
ncbi:GTP cyclohydrolase FolE2 [Acidihalobacter prosperus]|uniref:GTP cyclohydrolase FolE2 n=1 Tax=Acidihalobacter prosperus TaxID=160660 RepID=A0A1A6C5S9_9GAMM|nr:GTP cyclohydrolase FolE2 [Acidihalobacter prosperus]